MADLPTCCNFCYRRAVRMLIQRRRNAWQLLAGRLPRRVAVCSGSGCTRVAREHLRGWRRGLA